MPLVGISSYLFDRLSNDFLEDDQDIEDAIVFLLKFYDEHMDEQNETSN